jgi:hypothetical protein
MMLQGVDTCEWLTERKRELSEKAKENERQQKAKAEEQRLRREQHNKKRPAAESPDAHEESLPMEALKINFLATLNEKVSKLSFIERDLVWMRLLSFLDVVPGNYFDMLKDGLGSTSMLFLALSSSKDLHSVLSASDETLPYDQVETWIESAQNAFLQYVWHIICGCGCERLRLALKKLRIRSPKELITAWKNIPTALFNGLIKLDPALVGVTCKWLGGSLIETDNENDSMRSGKFTEECVKWMIDISTKTMSDLPFVKEYGEIIVDDVDDEDAGTPDDGNVESDDSWTTDIAAHPFLGKRCRVIVREMFSGMSTTTSHEESEIFFWEDGVVHSYLRPTPEEPMALWKVLLDAGSAAVNQELSPRFEDLEEDEVKKAIERLETCNFCWCSK